ncbi:TnsD family Tn7-like transposition protein [Niallia sp. JL1B1071]|uniref:TnsD family Tn7-like transposition protein n=1 Tax=Niallia tiangongensis TaxID=3237105 RepID=UPI0037DCD021
MNSESDSKKKVHKDNDLINERRSEWIQLQKEFPFLLKTKLREKVPAVYTFLYRNDRNWLNENSPELQKVETINNRVNWLERDQEVLKNIRKVVEDINSRNGKPLRITVL